MNMRLAMAWAMPLLLGVAAARADDLKSGLPVGKSVPAFDVVKCAGAPSDGVKVGQQLCYR